MSVSTVSATGIQDPSGQVFANGTWRLEFVPTYGTPGIYNDGGLPFTKQYGGSLDATGSFSQAGVNRSDTIAPAGSQWRFTAIPAVNGTTYSVLLNVNSPAFDVTTAINAVITNIVVSPTVVSRAYKDSELVNIDGAGGIYYDETLKVLKVWDAVTSTFLPITPNNGSPTFNNLTVTGQALVKNFENIRFADQFGGFTNASINAAIQDLPAAGGEVYLPAGTWVLTNPGTGQLILIDRPVTFRGAGERSTILQVASGIANTVPVVRVKPASSSIVLQDGWQFRDIDFESAGGVTAGDVFLMDGSVAGTTGPANIEFDHVYIQQANWGGRGIKTTGTASSNMWNWNIHDSTISNGILLDSASADTIKIIGNALSGPNAAVEVTSSVGASHLIVAFNNITNDGGAVVIHGATQPKILYNQIEQTNATTETNSAMIDVWGNSYTVDSAEIYGNNLNTHNNVTTCIQVNGASNTRIRGNVMTLKAVTGVGINITATATHTTVDANTYIGAGGGALEVQDAAPAGANATQFIASSDTQHEALRVLGTNSAANSAVIRGAVGQAANPFVVATSVGTQLFGVDALGGLNLTEATGFGGSAGKSVLWAESTAHRLKMNNNNGGADTVVGAATTDTLTNKRITKRSVAQADATSITVNSDITDIATQVNTQVAGTLTLNAPTGTPTDGQPLLIRIKSTNAQTYSFNAAFRFSTTTVAPTGITAGKVDLLAFVWNSTDSKWDVAGVNQGH